VIIVIPPPEVSVDFNLSFASINTNSLNVSVNMRAAQKIKIYGIAKLRADIIMVCDTRISETSGLSNLETIKHIFKFNPYRSYDCYFNSSTNSRGVGILIASDLGCSVLETTKDEDENFILIKIQYNEADYVIGSVYGPNKRDRRFFDKLTANLVRLGSNRIILAGDWNCVPNRTPIQVNIDCLNMVNVPNPGQSEYLLDLVRTMKLCDIYRAKFPVLREFSYVPYGTLRRNRSRIDFFLVTENLVPRVCKTSIGDTLISKSFDHKPIFCSFKKDFKGTLRGPSISNLVLKDTVIQLMSKLCAIETYVNNVEPEAYGANRINQARRTIGNCWNLLKLAGPDPIHLRVGDLSEEEILERDGLLQRVTELVNGFDLPTLEQLPLRCTAYEFYVNLTMTLKNEIASHQAFIWKTRTATKNKLRSKMEDFRITGQALSDEYFECEAELTKYIQYELESEFERSPLFDKLSNEKPSKFLSTLIKG